MSQNLNSYIKKSHLRAVEAFNNDLLSFAKETDEYPVTLYEDPYVTFTLSSIEVRDGKLCYTYDGVEERETVVKYDEEENDYYEEKIEGIMDYIKFWRACLRRARRYWQMDTEKLDAIQDGEVEDDEDEEE